MGACETNDEVTFENDKCVETTYTYNPDGDIIADDAEDKDTDYCCQAFLPTQDVSLLAACAQVETFNFSSSANDCTSLI